MSMASIIPKIKHIEGNCGYQSYPSDKTQSMRATSDQAICQCLLLKVGMTAFDKYSGYHRCNRNAYNGPINAPDGQGDTQKIHIKESEGTAEIESATERTKRSSPSMVCIFSASFPGAFSSMGSRSFSVPVWGKSIV
jgi:hypothetical protein